MNDMRSLSHTNVGARKQTRANKGEGQGGGGVKTWES